MAITVISWSDDWKLASSLLKSFGLTTKLLGNFVLSRERCWTSGSTLQLIQYAFFIPAVFSWIIQLFQNNWNFYKKTFPHQQVNRCDEITAHKFRFVKHKILNHVSRCWRTNYFLRCYMITIDAVQSPFHFCCIWTRQLHAKMINVCNRSPENGADSLHIEVEVVTRWS